MAILARSSCSAVVSGAGSGVCELTNQRRPGIGDGGALKPVKNSILCVSSIINRVYLYYKVYLNNQRHHYKGNTLNVQMCEYNIYLSVGS